MSPRALVRCGLPCLRPQSRSWTRSLLTRAHDRGPDEPPLIESTVPEHFSSIVSQHGDRPAVISRHQRAQVSYRELDEQSNALARGCQGIGVRKGDRVAVSLGNNLEYAKATYALFKIGAVLVPLNPSFNAQQVISALKHLEASHLMIGAETNLSRKPPRDNVSLLTQVAPDIKGDKLESESVPSLKEIVLVDNSAGRVDVQSFRATTPFEALMQESKHTLPDQRLHRDEVVNIQFTSGTTSMPKAACLTHRNILNNGAQIGDRMLLTPVDVVCCPPPLFHCFGCILGFMATATHGSSIVFPSEAFDPLAALQAVQEYRATALYGVATMFLAELELLSDGLVAHERLSIPSNRHRSGEQRTGGADAQAPQDP